MKNKNNQPSGISGNPTLTIALLAFSIGLVLVAFFVGMYWASQQQPDVQTVPVYPGGDEQMVEDAVDQDALEDIDPSTVSGSGVLNIDWLPLEAQSRSLPLQAFFLVDPDNVYDSDGAEAFRLGTVQGGDYDGYELSYHTIQLTGLGGWTFGVYVLQDRAGTSKPVILDRYASDGGGLLPNTVEQGSVIASLLESVAYRGEFAAALSDEVDFDTSASIPEFDDDVDQIDGAGRRYILDGLWHRSDELVGVDVSSYPVVALVDEGPMYMVPVSDEGGLSAHASRFFTLREDGRALIYDLDYTFWDEEGDSMQVPDVRRADGTSVDEEYFRGFLGGCGIHPVVNVVDPSDVGSLVSYGTTNAGASIYVTTDYSLDHFEPSRLNWYWRNDFDELYGDVNDEDAQAAIIAAFEAIDPPPFFYYEDTFGRLIEYTNANTTSGAECGKPVIYLYPEEEISLDVYVEPEGGFSFTEPVYNNGWRVSATPGSVITNLNDGQVYPYLFWEGRGGSYMPPEQYWVVAREEVPRFLAKTLRQIGFEGREVADFMEFWVPRMQDAPYYKVGFHGTRVMDELAPLTLSKDPDAVLRVLMDFEELEKPVAENPPYIPAFIRKGFTVTEWGGVIR